MGSQPTGIAEGPDGNIWFTTQGGGTNYVIQFNITSHTFSGTSLGAGVFPVGITSADSDLWVVGQDSLDLYQINTSGIIVNTLSTTYGGNFATAGPDGRLWITAGTHLMALTTSGTETDYTVPGASASAVGGITTGPNNNLWFTNSGSNTIDEVTTSGTFTAFDIPTSASLPAFIVSGPDGNLWFTEQASSANNVVSLSTSGTFTNYSIPTAASGAMAIATGPSNTLWFTEGSVSRIGEVSGLSVAGTSSTTPTTPNTGYGTPDRSAPYVLGLSILSVISITTGLFLNFRHRKATKNFLTRR